MLRWSGCVVRRFWAFGLVFGGGWVWELLVGHWDEITS